MGGIEQASAVQRMKKLETYLDQDPGNAVLIREATVCAFAAGLRQRGLDLTDLLVRLNPESADARVQVANLQMEYGLWKEAERHWAGLMGDGYTDHIDVGYARAYACYRMGEFDVAAEVLYPFLADLRDEWGGRVAALWMRSMHHAGREGNAWTWFKTNRTMCEPFVDVMGVASLIGVDCGDLESARALAKWTLKRAASGHREARIAAASVALLDGAVEECRIILRGVVSRSEEPRAWMTLGLAELMDLRFAEARKCLERAVAATDYGSAWRMLGWIHLFEGAPELARYAFSQAVVRDPTDVEAADALSQIALLNGQQAVDRARLSPGTMEKIRQLVRQALQGR